MDKDYTLIRARRKTVGLRMDRDGRLIVRAPQSLSEAQICRIVESHRAWISRQRNRLAELCAAHPEPTDEERKEYIKKAKELLPRRIAYYADLLGVTPAGLTITSARSRFGSCSGKNRLSFSWRLMDYPPEAIDYVVVHELAHIRHHDHSPAFYRLVASILPDHKERRELLKH